MKTTGLSFYFKAFLGMLIVLGILCIGTWLGTLYLRLKAGKDYSALSKNDLVVGDFRGAMVNLRAVTAKEFDQVRFIDSSGREVFALGDKPEGFYQNFFIPIGLVEGGPRLAKLEFVFSPIRNIRMAFFAWLGIVLLNIPALVYISRHLKQRYQKQEEDRSLAQLGMIYSQLAHDVRSPLTALNTLNPHMGLLKNEHQNLFRQATLRLEQIAGDILKRKVQIVTPVQDENKYAPAPAVFAPALNEQELVSIVEQSICFKSYEWKKNPPVEVVLHWGEVRSVNAEEGQLNRIISNLLNNSIEAGASKVTISTLVEANHLMLEIRDNGSGILEEQIQKIESSETFSSKPNGHGLGLSHARKVLRGWGGNLIVRSTAGVGTTMIIKLTCSLN